MNFAASDRSGFKLSIVMIASNSLWFCLQYLFGRKQIGAGTFVNWFAVGPLITFFTAWLASHWPAPQAFFSRLLVMGTGVLILSLATSLYQTADLGVSPYDSISIFLAERTSIPYFWCRIFTDFFVRPSPSSLEALWAWARSSVRWAWGRSSPFSRAVSPEDCAACGIEKLVKDDDQTDRLRH